MKQTASAHVRAPWSFRLFNAAGVAEHQIAAHFRTIAINSIVVG